MPVPPVALPTSRWMEPAIALRAEAHGSLVEWELHIRRGGRGEDVGRGRLRRPWGQVGSDRGTGREANPPWLSACKKSHPPPLTSTKFSYILCATGCAIHSRWP